MPYNCSTIENLGNTMKAISKDAVNGHYADDKERRRKRTNRKYVITF